MKSLKSLVLVTMIAAILIGWMPMGAEMTGSSVRTTAIR